MRGLQVPRGVIEAIANIVGEGVCVRCVVSPCSGRDHLPFIDQGKGDLQACRTV
jgi:hypothetical protein